MTINALTDFDYRPKTVPQTALSFGGKVPVTSDEFETLARVSRARAFRIAGVQKIRLIEQVQNVVRRGLRDGTPYRDIQLRIVELFEGAGLKSPSIGRLKIVMHQNMVGAYQVARRRFLERPAVAESFQWWRYMTQGNGTPGVNGVRPEHAALHSKIFRADDPIWDRIYPPWDWGCRCFVIPMTAGQVKAAGGDRAVKTGDWALNRAPVADGTGTKGVTVPREFDFPRDQLFGPGVLQTIDSALKRLIEERFRDIEEG